MQLVSHRHDAAGASQSMRCTCASRAPGGCACWAWAGCEFVVPETLEVRLEICTAYDGRVPGTRDQRRSAPEPCVLAATGRMPARRGGEQTRVVKTKLSSRTRARARPADAPTRACSPSGGLRLRDGGDARCGELLSWRQPSSFAVQLASPPRAPHRSAASAARSTWASLRAGCCAATDVRYAPLAEPAQPDNCWLGRLVYTQICCRGRRMRWMTHEVGAGAAKGRVVAFQFFASTSQTT